MNNFDNSITEQQRWYQIGKECIERPLNGRTRFEVLEQIGNKYGYAVSSLKRLMDYKNAADRLRAIVPEATADILAGKLKLSLANTIALSHKQTSEIIHVIDSLSSGNVAVSSLIRTRRQAHPGDGGIPKEQRWYQIGKQFQEERQPGMASLHQTSQRIGLEYDYAESSVRMFADYAKAIDQLQLKAPEIVPDILSGKLRLSLVNTSTLSRKSPEEIRRIVQFLANPGNKVKDIFPGASKKPKTKKQATIKDLPAYDPDSHVIGLSYTIPSWVSQIDSAFRTTDFGRITIKAHRRLVNALKELKDITETMLTIMMEEPSDERKK